MFDSRKAEAGFTIQLPEDREGYKLLVTSTQFQAIGEASAMFTPEGRTSRAAERYVEGLLARRREEESKRERERRARELRWAAIAEGLEGPLTVAEAIRRNGDKPGRSRTLLVDDGPRKRGAKPLSPVVRDEDGRELLSVAEASNRSGIPVGSFSGWIAAGKVKSVKRAGTRIAAEELERLTAEKVAA